MSTEPGPPQIIFLCVHNAGRSQMAAAWLTHLAGNQAAVLSGGSNPGATVNPAAVEAMAEVGIDMTGAQPHRWTDADVESADVVITMGCGDTCPIFPGTTYEDWPVADPAGQGVDAVRPIRDELRTRVEDLMQRLELLAAT